MNPTELPSRTALPRGLPLRATALLCASSLAALALISCGGSDPDPIEATKDAQVKYAWTEVGPNAQVVARAVTADAACPKIMVNGQLGSMSLRAASGTVAQRPTASDPADSKPSVFAVTSCETVLPAHASAVYAAGRQLALPKAEPGRIVLLADTGCRLKKADNAFQACADGTAWPFATIAASAAAMKPDLVIHMGDYHYRENACPSDVQGCKDTPWGYGWDTWEADLFKPGAPLLAAAPWVVVRGNHEECARAGQGWARFLDPSPYSATRSCDLTANDNTGNFTEPYAVALGAATQIVIFDSAKAGTAALPATDFKVPLYKAQFQTVAALAAAKPAVTTLFANHHPILAYAPIAGGTPIAGNAALLGVMSGLNASAYYPPGIKLAMHGHVHDFQAVNYTSDHPATIVTGNGGDNVDVNLPDPFPMTVATAGTVLQSVTHTNTYGFMVMDRIATGWAYKAYTRDGKLLTTCTTTGAKIACDKTGFINP